MLSSPSLSFVVPAKEDVKQCLSVVVPAKELVNLSILAIWRELNTLDLMVRRRA